MALQLENYLAFCQCPGNSRVKLNWHKWSSRGHNQRIIFPGKLVHCRSPTGVDITVCSGTSCGNGGFPSKQSPDKQGGCFATYARNDRWAKVNALPALSMSGRL